MAYKHEPRRNYEESFKVAAVDFLQKSGNSLDAAATELGVSPADLRTWQKKCEAQQRPAKPTGGIARLKAENEALRNEVRNLQVQWDILKTTLGVLSTTVCSREMV